MDHLFFMAKFFAIVDVGLTKIQDYTHVQISTAIYPLICHEHFPSTEHFH